MNHEDFLSAQCLSWDNVPVERLPDGIERRMFIGHNLMLCLLKFPANTVTTAHEHPHEQMTLVMRGKVRFLIGNEERVVSAGELLRFPPNCWHGATILDEEAELLDIFTPVREDFLPIR